MKYARRTLLGRLFFWPLLAAGLLLPAGCAKSPGTGSSSPVSGPQLIVTMTVAGNINPNYYYYVLFNVNNRPGPGGTAVTGPVPVITNAYNTGTGFAAGAFTNYVEYNGTQGSNNNFDYYLEFSDPQSSANLLSRSLGQGQLFAAQASGSTLTFRLPLAYLAPAGYPELSSTVTADLITSLQVNFIATNFVPVATQNLNTTKYFDALYPPSQAGNSYVPLIVRNIASGAIMAGIYTNSTSGVNETSGDVGTQGNGGAVVVSRPSSGIISEGTNNINYDDLDITDWSITLTSGS